MERRKSNHTKRVLKDFALSNRLCDKFQSVISVTQAKVEDLEIKLEDAESELEDAQTEIEDLTSELDDLRGMYLVQHPTSLTALMELEERLA